MKKLFCSLIMLFPLLLFAQTKGKNDNEKFEPIQLYFVMLVKGPNRTQDSITAAKIQEGQMANIGKLAKEGKLIVAGPFMDDTNWRGLFILKCQDAAECENLLKTDPAISSGRLTYEVHPWMTGKNCLFK
ncbi:YciI family protein [Danxiaibacter flavus]|uniref:YciI family protein n=1 Tax=Danxiaibacter flavus TaxID=3049108 RepID=A0ABV3ZA06_9BACT|nr:YciI family protein [Chitinophagaceae bacterium DXS]